MKKIKILVTNDDGYQAKGLLALVKVLKQFGEVLVVAPKSAQSGMSMAVTMGLKPIAVKHLNPSDPCNCTSDPCNCTSDPCNCSSDSRTAALFEACPGLDLWYLDGTPASCIKYGIDNILWPERPDIVISGVNHGSNAATASIYSGTVGAAMEGAVNGIPSIAVSLDSFASDADFTNVGLYLPDLLRKLLPHVLSGADCFGAFYNINIPLGDVKGVRVGTMGMGHWEKEYVPYLEYIENKGLALRPADKAYLDALEEGESAWVMAGDFVSNEDNPADADHLLLEDGLITVTPANIDNTAVTEISTLCDIIS